MAGMATTLLCARRCESSRGQWVSRVTQSEYEWMEAIQVDCRADGCRGYRKKLFFAKWRAQPIEIRICNHLAQVLVPSPEWRGARACGCSTANCCWKFVGKWPLSWGMNLYWYLAPYQTDRTTSQKFYFLTVGSVCGSAVNGCQLPKDTYCIPAVSMQITGKKWRAQSRVCRQTLNICNNMYQFQFWLLQFLVSAEGSLPCIVSVKAMAAHATPTGGPGKKGAGRELQEL